MRPDEFDRDAEWLKRRGQVAVAEEVAEDAATEAFRRNNRGGTAEALIAADKELELARERLRQHEALISDDSYGSW